MEELKFALDTFYAVMAGALGKTKEKKNQKTNNRNKK